MKSLLVLNLREHTIKSFVASDWLSDSSVVGVSDSTAKTKLVYTEPRLHHLCTASNYFAYFDDDRNRGDASASVTYAEVCI